MQIFNIKTIPSVVQAAFTDVADKSIIDENKDYRELITSVESTEKFGLQQIEFEDSSTANAASTI